MKGLEIIVRGPAGSGKSTFAHEVANALRALGLEVEIDDIDPPVQEATYVMRLEALKKHMARQGNKIVIKVRQTPRPGAAKARFFAKLGEMGRYADGGVNVEDGIAFVDTRPSTKSLLDWGDDGLYDDTRATHLHGLCHSSNDGECAWRECPQLKDGEPDKTGRHCPLDTRKDEES